MASNQTIFSELTVALGILDSDNLDDISGVSQSQKRAFSEEKAKRDLSMGNAYERGLQLKQSGLIIRNYLSSANGLTRPTVSWTGSNSQGVNHVAKDLDVSGLLRISVKENADVFRNASATNVLEKIPSGITPDNSQGDDWFIKLAENEFQQYYEACSGPEFNEINGVRDFYENRDKQGRKPFGNHVAALHKQKNSAVLIAYKLFCESVSRNAAGTFNKNLRATIDSGEMRNIFRFMVEYYFRINGVKHVLAGTDKGEPFAVEVPDNQEWSRKYECKDINAIERLVGQPEVMLNFKFLNKETKKEFDFPIRIELRWSHGKFCGNPEAKLYKSWKYEDLPWVKNLKVI
jgi:hypothetical protein